MFGDLGELAATGDCGNVTTRIGDPKCDIPRGPIRDLPGVRGEVGALAVGASRFSKRRKYYF
jgi:hypothetical protein